MSPVLWMLVGAWIGAPIGVLAIALCQAAARGDAPLDPTSRRQAEMEQRVWDAANRSNE